MHIRTVKSFEKFIATRNIRNLVTGAINQPTGVDLFFPERLKLSVKPALRKLLRTLDQIYQKQN
jgi:hypothetical protein